MLTVNQVVNVSASIAPTGLLRRDFGRTLFLTVDESIPSNERIRVYTSMDDVAADFAVGSEPYKAASIYFQQVPYPKNLLVGRWFNDVTDALLKGGAAAAHSAFVGLNDAAFKIKMGLTADYATEAPDEYAITVNLTATESLADVAQAIETAVQAAIVDDGFTATVEFDATVGFILTLTADDNATIVSLSYAYAPAAGTDISALLGWTEGAAVFKQSSTVVETIEDALTACASLNGSFYFVTAENTVINDTANSDAISAWVASRQYMYSADSSDLAVLSKADSVFHRLSLLEPGRTFGTWSRTADYKGVSAAGRLSSVNFNARNSLITLKFKELPGTLADTALTPTQASALADQAVNFYSERSGVPMYEEGYTFDKDVWADVRYWLDWFVDAAQVELFNVLKTIPTRVPQTEEGMNALKNALISVCRQGVSNGGLAGGQLSAALTLDVQQSTGNASFDGYLANGYLVYADSVATMSQSDRAQRKAPPIKVWLKGSGAIHFVDVIVTFEN